MGLTVADLLVRFAADTRDADAGFAHMDQSINGFQQKNNGMLSSLASVGSIAAGAAVTGIVALGGAMTATAVSGTQMAMDLESQISGITSVLGESAESVAPLKQAILDLGLNPNLKVSTLEAADAMEALATQGLTMQEIIGGAAEATVLLSNATGGDFAQSANIMADSMNLFGESAGSYQDAVNGVVAVSNVSKFTVNDYALALAQAGGVASSVGVEFNDFNTSIAAISSLFGSGSDAGTSFKTMLSRLIPGSKEASEAMGELGLLTVDYSAAAERLSGMLGREVSPKIESISAAYTEFAASQGIATAGSKEMGKAFNSFLGGFEMNQFFDANGQLKSMADISGVLAGALDGLTEEQKNQALATIFGSDAMRAAVGLAKVGKDGFEELQATMGNTDSLDAAAMRMDNAKGAMEILGGVIETVKIQIGDAFIPVVKQLATQLATFVTNNSGRITMFFQTFASVIGAVASGIPALVNSLFGLFSVFAAVTSSVVDFITEGELLSTSNYGLDGSIVQVANGIRDFILAIYEGVSAIMAFVSPIVSVIASFVSWQDVLIALGAAIVAVVVPAIAAFVVAWAPVIGAVLAVIGVVAMLRNAWESDFLGIRTVVLSLTTAITDLVTGSDFTAFVSRVWDAFLSIGQAIGSFFSGDISLGGLASAVASGFSEIVGALSAFFGGGDWSGFLEAIRWNDFISLLTWENFVSVLDWIGYIASLAWTDYIAPLLWAGWLALLDWGSYVKSLPWNDYISGALDWAVYIGAFLWTDYVAPLLWNTLIAVFDWAQWLTTLDWTSIITTVIDWATWIPALTWTAFVTLLEWGTYIAGALVWGTYVTVVALADFVTSLSWADFVAVLDWVGYIVSFTWESFVEKLEWTGFISKMASWGDYIVAVDWTSFIVETLKWGLYVVALAWNTFVTLIEWADWLVSLSWDDYAEMLRWDDYANPFEWSTFIKNLAWSDWIGKSLAWADFVLSLVWTDFVSKLTWPDVSFSWSNFVSHLSWPSISFPGWSSFIPSFPGWPNISGMISGLIGGGDSGSTESGGSSSGGGSKSGSRSTIGVREQQSSSGVNVATLAAAIAEAMQSQPLVVNLAFNATITGEADAQQVSYQMARRISDIIQRRAT